MTNNDLGRHHHKSNLVTSFSLSLAVEADQGQVEYFFAGDQKTFIWSRRCHHGKTPHHHRNGTCPKK